MSSFSTVRYDEIFEVYQKIDLMRAKYRHVDLTSKAWCFHGNKIQDWSGGSCVAGRLTSTGNLAFSTPTGITIDPVTHPWISYHIDLTITRPSSSYEGILSYPAQNLSQWLGYAGYTNVTTSGNTHLISGVVFPGSITTQYSFLQFAVLERQFIDDVSKIPIPVTFSRVVGSTSIVSNAGSISPKASNMTQFCPTPAPGTIVAMTLAIAKPNWWPAAWVLSGALEYFKFDVRNVFAPLSDEELAITTDFNVMRDEVELLNKASVSWENPLPVSSGSRVLRYVDAILITDLEQARNTLAAAAPYNGCATCDVHTCTCDITTYGSIPCTVCNACNRYSACSSCDGTSYGYTASTCSCQTTYGYTAGTCACQAAHGISTSSCICNSGTCYGYSAGGTVTTCGCNSSNNNNAWVCFVQRGQIYDSATGCSACYGVTNAWCAAGNAACGPSFDFVGCYCVKAAYTITVVARCQAACYTQEQNLNAYCSSCYSGYSSYTTPGSPCSCNTCYGQPTTACTCNGSCYSVSAPSCACNGQCHSYSAATCTCYSKCYSYTGCSICNACNGYGACSCNVTCHQQSCAQCDMTGYSTAT